ncbi:MAG: hypothetical protein IRY85_05790 [Micromonosporaceae bacterium]|nr:hypothetical protein [Micromonosporaceae bacterium]
MRSNLVDAWLGPLRTRWSALLAVAGLTLGPAVALTSLLFVLDSNTGAIINGSIITNYEPTVRTLVVLSIMNGQAQVRVVIPLLVALAWFIGLGTALRVLAGRSVRTAWRRVPPARLAEWLALGALLAGLALLGLHASVAAAGRFGGPAGVLTAVLWTYGLARLALALPAMLVDGRRLPDALRRAVVARRGHLATGALILPTVLSPAVVLAWLDPAILPTGRSWVSDVLWSAVVLLEYMILVVAVPLQAVGLFRAYRVVYPAGSAASSDGYDPLTAPESSLADREPGEPTGFLRDEHELTVIVHDGPLVSAYGRTAWPSPTPTWAADVMTPGRRQPEARTEDERPAGPHPSLRWLRSVAVALLCVGPAAVGPALMLVNPNNLPVLTVAVPPAGFSTRPLTMAVLIDGTVVSVDPTQVALCRDAHCTDVDLLTMPCSGGAPPTPAGTRSCPTEGPILAADVTPDGTLLALVANPEQPVRLVWCRLAPSDDGQCRWGGAITLYEPPDQEWDRSMSVTALPGGGFAAVIAAPGPGETRSTVRLISCERLDCPQPTVHTVPTLPRPTQVGGLIDVSADPRSGTLALGYVDRSDETLYLGGCPAGCPDGPIVTRIGPWPELTPVGSVPDRPALQVLASATGPAAALQAIGAQLTPRPPADPQGVLPELLSAMNVVVTCGDPGCITPRRTVQGLGLDTMTLVANQAGQAYIVGSTPDLTFVEQLRDDSSYGWSFDFGPVVTAVIGPDNRLRLLFLNDRGPELVTLTRPALAF